LSGRPTEFKYCRYPAPKGRCHGNHFLPFYTWGAHWRHLANTTKPSVCGGDAALRQITLTTCYYRERRSGLIYRLVLVWDHYRSVRLARERRHPAVLVDRQHARGWFSLSAGLRVHAVLDRTELRHRRVRQHRISDAYRVHRHYYVLVDVRYVLRELPACIQ